MLFVPTYLALVGTARECILKWEGRFATSVFLGAVALGLIVLTPAVSSSIQWFGSGENHEIARTAGLLLTGFTGLAIAVWHAIIADRNNSLEERKWALQRLKEGAEMLASEHLITSAAGRQVLW